MKTMMFTAAALALALGAGSAMARGPEIHNRVGAFGKGGPGVEVHSIASAQQPVTPTSQTLADQAAPTTRPAQQYACPMHPEVTSTQPGKCPKCGMALEKKAAEAKPDGAHQH